MTGGFSTIDAVIPPASEGWRLDRALAAAVPTLSRERIKSLISAGAVSSGGVAVRDPAAKARQGTMYSVNLPALKPAHNVPQDIAIPIVFEDDHLLVVDKPAGMVVHPAAGNPDGTLVNALLHHCAGRLSGINGVSRPGIVHRIDKDTSGLLVVAKTDRAHEGLAAQFASHSISRRYAALLSGIPRPPAGTVDAPLARSQANRKKVVVVAEGRGKRAVTHYATKATGKDVALVECRLETGRTHQVRVHMAHIGHPLIGDPVYGRARAGQAQILRELGFHRQALHARHLGFNHPVTRETLAFESEIPDDMQQLFGAFGV